MGYKIENTTFDTDTNELELGSLVEIIETKEKGIIVMKIGSLYQVQKEDGTVSSYTRKELHY